MSDKTKNDEVKEDSKNQIKIIKGNGSNLDISPVFNHISQVKPKSKDKSPKNIVIPNSNNNKKKNNT